jgi:hypothetical protein
MSPQSKSKTRMFIGSHYPTIRLLRNTFWWRVPDISSLLFRTQSVGICEKYPETVVVKPLVQSSNVHQIFLPSAKYQRLEQAEVGLAQRRADNVIPKNKLPIPSQNMHWPKVWSRASNFSFDCRIYHAPIEVASEA